MSLWVHSIKVNITIACIFCVRPVVSVETWIRLFAPTLANIVLVCGWSSVWNVGPLIGLGNLCNRIVGCLMAQPGQRGTWHLAT